MRTDSTKWLWCLIFLMSAVTSTVLIAELKGFSILPASQAKLIDHSWVSKSIVAVFLLSLTVNAKNTLALWQEEKHLRRGLIVNHSCSELTLVGSGLLGLHAARMKQIYGASFDGDVSQSVSLGAIRSKLDGQEWFVRVASQLLLTLGLIGTVIGLANSLEGLSGAMTAVVSPTISSGTVVQGGTSLAGGFKQAVSGMATAFATTLFGAILGGVFLKLLFSCTQHLADELVDEIEITTETQLVPLLRASKADLATRRRDALAVLDQTASSEQIRMKTIASCIERYSEKLEVLLKQVSRLEPLPIQDADQRNNSRGLRLPFVNSTATQLILPATLGAFFATLGWICISRLGS